MKKIMLFAFVIMLAWCTNIESEHSNICYKDSDKKGSRLYKGIFGSLRVI